LDDEPWLVGWENWASAVELGDVQGAGLCAWWGEGNLEESQVNMMFMTTYARLRKQKAM